MHSEINISQLTDAQIRAWFEMKLEENGQPYVHIGFGTEYQVGQFVASVRDKGGLVYGFGATVEEALQELRGKISSPGHRAARLKAKATELLHEAEKLCPTIVRMEVVS